MGASDSEQKGSEFNAEERNAMALVGGIREPVLVLSKDLYALAANNTFFSAFGLSEKEIKGLDFFSLNNGAWDLPVLRQLLQKDLPREKQVHDVKIGFDKNLQKSILELLNKV